jgi:hypothetical protein
MNYDHSRPTDANTTLYDPQGCGWLLDVDPRDYSVLWAAGFREVTEGFQTRGYCIDTVPSEGRTSGGSRQCQLKGYCPHAGPSRGLLRA